MRRTLLISLGILGAFGTTRSASAVTTVSNVSNPDSAHFTLLGGATSFTTGPAPAVLLSVSLPYFTTSNFGMSGDGGIWSDASGHLGIALETFPEQLRPPGYGTVAFNSAGLHLDPFTTYWFSFNVHTASYWLDTSLTDEMSDFGWSIGDRSLGSTPDNITIGRMSIDATILPEPSSLGACGLAALALLRRRRTGTKAP